MEEEQGGAAIGYPGSEDEQRVDADALKSLVAEIFGRCGMSQADAHLVADTLLRADLRGVHSHGVQRVPLYVGRLLDRGVDPKGVPRVVTDARAALVVDGGNSMGQVGGAFAMRQAIERARETSLAIAAVRGSNHCGAMDYYAMLAAAGDMIGVATTNALPTMAPWGSIDKILGINPLSIAIPAGEEPDVVIDTAFSASSHGKIEVYHQKGLPIPAGWASDPSGKPTTDAEQALAGLLQPIGAYKGSGFAMIMGMLSTLLSGAAYGTELGNMIDGAKPGADGHLFMAINISAFESVPRFKSRVDQIVRQTRGSRPAAGVDRVFLPGEREFEAERRYREAGIPLNAVTLSGMAAAAERVGVDPGGLV